MELALIIAIVALAALAVGLRIRRALTNNGGCACGHGCSSACAVHRPLDKARTPTRNGTEKGRAPDGPQNPAADLAGEERPGCTLSHLHR